MYVTPRRDGAFCKAWFPYDRPDRLDRPSRSRNVQTIGTTETIAGFHMIVSIASKTEVARSSTMLTWSSLVLFSLSVLNSFLADHH